MPLFTELPRGSEAVEKVGAGPVNDLESSSQRPEIGVSGVRSGISNGHEGVFQQGEVFSETRAVASALQGYYRTGAITLQLAFL
jgi:hypothetical protein